MTISRKVKKDKVLKAVEVILEGLFFINIDKYDRLSVQIADHIDE